MYFVPQYIFVNIAPLTKKLSPVRIPASQIAPEGSRVINEIPINICRIASSIKHFHPYTSLFVIEADAIEDTLSNTKYIPQKIIISIEFVIAVIIINIPEIKRHIPAKMLIK